MITLTLLFVYISIMVLIAKVFWHLTKATAFVLFLPLIIVGCLLGGVFRLLLPIIVIGLIVKLIVSPRII